METKTALEILLREGSLLHMGKSVALVPETEVEPFRFYGVREYRPAKPFRELRKETAIHGSLTEYCMTAIPWNGDKTENNHGVSVFHALPDLTETMTLNEIQKSLEKLLESQALKPVLKGVQEDLRYRSSGT